MNLKARIEALERLAKPGERNPLADMPLSQFMEHCEQLLELPVGSLPRSPEEAQRAGFDSMAEAMASALGITYSQLKQYIEKGGEDGRKDRGARAPGA